MMIRAVVVVAGLLGAPLACAQSIDVSESDIAFIATQMGVAVEGRLPKFSAQINFEPNKLDQATARIEIDLASINAGSEEASAEVKKKSWFNLAAFPTATFVSTAVKQLATQRYVAQGQLTIKGITNNVTVPFTVRFNDGETIYEGGFTLLRLAFKIGEGAWSDSDTVADEVRVRFRIVQTRTANLLLRQSRYLLTMFCGGFSEI